MLHGLTQIALRRLVESVLIILLLIFGAIEVVRGVFGDIIVLTRNAAIVFLLIVVGGVVIVTAVIEVNFEFVERLVVH